MDHGQLTRGLVTPLLDPEDSALQQTALEIVGRHASWGDEVVRLAKRWLRQHSFTERQESVVCGTLLAFQQDPQIQKLIADTLSKPTTSIHVQRLLLSVMEQTEVQPPPEIWIKPLTRLLTADDNELAAHAIATVAAIGGE